MNKLLSRLGLVKGFQIGKYVEVFSCDRLQMEILSRKIKQNKKKFKHKEITVHGENEVIIKVEDDPLLNIKSVSEVDKWSSITANARSIESFTSDLIMAKIKPMTDVMLSNIPAAPVEVRTTDDGTMGDHWAQTARDKELTIYVALTALERLINTKDNNLLEEQLKQITILLSKNPWLRDVQDFSKPAVCFLKVLGRKAIRENIEELVFLVREVRVRLGSWPRDLVGSGVRVLSIDGGGMRGIVVLTVLRELEKYAGCKTHEMFDMIVGTSTGAVIASLLGIRSMSAGEALNLYKKFGHTIFSQTLIHGASQLLSKHSYYDEEILERTLRVFFDQRTMLETVRSMEIPAVSFVSSLVTKEQVQPHLFTNYMLPIGVQPTFPTTSDIKQWMALRASCAAPGYFPDMVLGGKVHQDGGIMANNPSHLALLEAQSLWPGEPLHCLLSLGSGRFLFQGGLNNVPEPLTTKDKVVRVLDTIADTETVHHVLSGLLSPDSYCRMNPPLSGELPDMDETREEMLIMMEKDVERYLRNNEDKVKCLINRLIGDGRTGIVKKIRRFVINSNMY